MIIKIIKLIIQIQFWFGLFCELFYYFFFQEKEEEEQERREREYVERMAAERLASLEGGNSLNIQQTQELLNGNVVAQSPQDMSDKL